MKRQFRLGLSIIVALGWCLGRGLAQSPDPNIPQVRVFAPLANLVGPQTPVAGHAGGPMLSQSYKCGQHHNWYGCGGWHAQNVFAFGSCRRFFTEYCPPLDSGETLFGKGQGVGTGSGRGFGTGVWPGGCDR